MAERPTRLAKMDESTKQRLVNWGYAAAHEVMLLNHPEQSIVGSVPALYPFLEEGIGPISVKVDCFEIEEGKAAKRDLLLPKILYKQNHLAL